MRGSIGCRARSRLGNRTGRQTFSSVTPPCIGSTTTRRYFPRLLGSWRPSGIFTAQMLHNHQEPGNRVLYGLARSDRWKDQVGDLVVDNPVSTPAAYYDMLNSGSHSLDVWESIYQQRLQVDEAVAQ